jgi:hypothetical protein
VVTDRPWGGDIDGRLARWSVVVPCVPVVVMVIRKLTGDWQPLGDAAYFAVRSRDVLTANHPLLGAWSSGSAQLDESVNNLGPLQLDLLAPFTHLLGPEGLAIGIGTLNVAGVMGVWFVCRRMIGPVGVVAVMGVTALLEWTMGSRALIEGRQQWALMLPFWCLLFLAWAVSAGRAWALPWLMFVVSLIVQTHLTFALPAGMIAVVAVVGFALTRWTTGNPDRDPEPLLRPMMVAAAVGALCWAQPLWDQFWGTGNLGRAVGARGDAAGVGGARGARVLTDILGQPPYWLADSIPKFDPSDQLMDESSAWLRLAILGAVTLGAAALAVLRPSTHARTTLALWGPVLLAIAWWAASTIPFTSFGLAPQNYHWIWPIGAFVTISITSSLAEAVSTHVAVPRHVVVSVVAAGTVLAMVPNMPTVVRERGTSAEEDAMVGVAGELRSELADSLVQLGLDEPVVFDRSQERTFSRYAYVVMAELQRQGVAFGFDREIDGERFGDRRRLDAEQASGMRRLYLVTGTNLDLVDDDLVQLATASAVTPADDARRIELDRRLVGALADGQLIVDMGGAFEIFGERVDRVVAVVDGQRPGRRGVYELVRIMSGLQNYDLLGGPQELLDAIDEWIVLHRANELDRVAIFVDPA